MTKIIVLHDKYNNQPIVIRLSAIKAVQKAFDGAQDMYSEVMIESLFISVKEPLAEVMRKITEAESEDE